MGTKEIVTPTDAFEQLKSKASNGLWQDGAENISGFAGYVTQFEYMPTVPYKSIADPESRTHFDAILSVVAVNDNLLVLQILACWTSVYGFHRSLVEYIVDNVDDHVTITVRRQQYLPTPPLADIDMHTGGVSVADYHKQALNSLADLDMPVIGMVVIGEGEDRVDPQDLVNIAKAIVRERPLF